MKPINKLNGGMGATLCHACSVIIDHHGLNDHLLCPKCQERALNIIRSLWTDANMALDEDWDKSDEGFKAQIELIEEFTGKIDYEES